MNYRLFVSILILSIVSFSIRANESKGDFYKKNNLLYSAENGKPYSGKINYTYPDGSKKSIEVYKNGKADGKFTDFYESGNLKSEKIFRDGLLNGKCHSWYRNGRIKEEYSYKNGKLNGEYKKFYENGKIKIMSDYKNNKLDGEVIEYYKNGLTKKISNFKENKLNGLVIYWNEKGEILSRDFYENGKKTSSGFIFDKKLYIKLLTEDEKLKRIIDENIKNYLKMINDNIKYFRENKYVVVVANKKIIERIEKDLKLFHSFYFMEEDQRGLDIAVDLVENTKEIPDDLSVVKSSYIWERTGKQFKDYYFRSRDNKVETVNHLRQYVSELTLPYGYKIYFRKIATNKDDFTRTYVFKSDYKFSGIFIKNVKVSVDSRTDTPYIDLSFNNEGKKLLAEITGKLLGHRLGILLDNTVDNVFVVQAEIKEGRATITLGAGNKEEILKKANIIAGNLRISSFIKYIKLIE